MHQLLAGLFLLCPYLQLRDELYLGPLWFLIAAATAAGLARRRLILGLAWGVAVAVSQWVWVLSAIPAVAFRRAGRPLYGSCAIAGAVALAALAPFALTDGFREGVFEHYQTVRSFNAFNLSFFSEFVDPSGVALRLVQIALFAAFLAAAFLRARSTGGSGDGPGRRVAVGVFGLCMFIMTNSHVWSYFYLTVAFALLGVVVVHDAEEAQRAIRTAPPRLA